MKIIFTTDRLTIRSLKLSDEGLFYEMMSNPEVMNPIPRPILDKQESLDKLIELIQAEPDGKKMVWAITMQDFDQLIGICGFIINSDGNPEIAYRFRPEYWGKGYGTETAEALLKYGFDELNYGTIDADANLDNTNSVKILDKFMVKIREFWNENDNCYDVRFRLERN